MRVRNKIIYRIQKFYIKNSQMGLRTDIDKRHETNELVSLLRPIMEDFKELYNDRKLPWDGTKTRGISK